MSTAESPGSSAAAPLRAVDGSPIYTVAQLTHEIRDVLEERLGSVWVTGEVSNFRQPVSGHCYFTLKDELAQISVVMWRGTAAGLKFELKDGMSLILKGELTVYEPRGQYQLVLKRAEPLGTGALQLAFLQLKQKLAEEGLFDPERKKPLPLIPKRIAIVTSSTGAAIRDILNVIFRRFPGAKVLVCPVRVQGEGAAGEIAEMISAVNRIMGIDVMIVGRGGGSLEDLWAFNEEVVARAMAGSRIPVISAVGHETDFTIADFVADVRGLTPTDAGSIVVPDAEELTEGLNAFAARLGQALMNRLVRMKDRLHALGRSYALRRPVERVRAREQRLDDLSQRFYRGMAHRVQVRQQRLGAAGLQLESLSPLAVLGRGYSITQKEPSGTILKDARKVKQGALVRTRLEKGEFTARVAEVIPPKKSEKSAAPKPAKKTSKSPSRKKKRSKS